MNEIKVFAPATVANVGPGFDLLGFALNTPGDQVVLKKTSSKKLKIVSISGDDGVLSKEVDKNCVTVAIKHFLKKVDYKGGFEVTLKKKMPIGSGLGSSSASSVAGVFAANEILGSPLNKKELIPFAMEGERVACGSAHADNVAPCLMGGFVIISSYKPLEILQIKTDIVLYASVVYPNIVIKTCDARKILPKNIPLGDVVTQMGSLSGLIMGIRESKYDLIKSSLKDVIVEPQRAKLIPSFYKIKQKVMNMGGIGCSISGSGPSIFALSTTLQKATALSKMMAEEFKKIKTDATVYVSKINNSGAIVLEEK